MNTTRVMRGTIRMAMLLLGGALITHAQTTGDVTWTGGGASPEWNVAGNWDPDAPANPTPGTVTFGSGGQSVTGVVETARGIHRLAASGTHTIDLGATSLTISNRLSSSANLAFKNGTLRMGTVDSVSDIYLGPPGRLSFQSGVSLNPVNIGIINMTANGSAHSFLDLRGVTIVGGELAMQRLLMPGQSWFGTHFYLNGTTTIGALTVTEMLWLARANVNNNARQFIGDPSDTFTYDGATGFGRFPAGVDLNVGVSATERASLWVAEDTGGYYRSLGVIRVAPGGGGSFTAYLDELKIGMRSGTGVRRPRGMLHLSEMDTCLLDALVLELGPGRVDAISTDVEWGELHLPPGTATIGTATLGAVEGAGFGRLVLNETVFTVTNALFLRKTGEVTINVGATPTGLGIDQGFSDEGGTIHVNFNAQPTAETNWAVRIKGDAVDVLSGMIGQDRLTRTIDGAITGRKTGIVSDDTYTYFALVDENLAFPPVAIAKDVTLEIGPDNLVSVAPADVDNGSFDPEDLETPPQLRLIYDGGPETNVLEFTSTGAYAVTLVANVLDGEGDVAASATADATVTVVAVPAGTQNDVEWIGEAGTVLMTDRGDWFWSGNWAGGEPPANPTSGTILYRTLGQGMTGRLAADRTVANISAGQSGYTTTHTIDLGANILTVTNQLAVIADGTNNRDTLIMTNGTVRIGTETAQGNIAIGQASTLTVAPGTQLDPHNVHTISLTTGAYRDALLDLRGAIVTGGSLKSRRLLVNGQPWWGARIYINEATSMSAIEVSEQFELGNSSVDNSFVHYIGDPANTFVMDTMTFGKLPAGIDITVGVSSSARASMLIARDYGGHSYVRAALRVAPGGGGTFTAYLTSLDIGLRSGTGTRRPRGMLHLAEMDTCLLDTLTLDIAPGRGIDTLDTDNERGELHLPPGTATIGTATIGAPDGVGWGLLSLSNTAFTVTNSLTLNNTAQITIDVGEESSGIDLTADAPGAFTLDPGATLTVTFHAPAAGAGLHYGLRLAGDHATALETLTGLTIDSTGLAGKEAIVFTSQGATYLGIPPPPGSLFLLR